MTQPTEETIEMGNVKALKAENERLRKGLANPDDVLMNMLRGGVAKPHPRSLAKLYTMEQLLDAVDCAQGYQRSALEAALKGGE